MKNLSNPVQLTLPESQYRSCFDKIYINRRHCLGDSFQACLELHPPQPRITGSRSTSNCILLDRVLLWCPIFPLLYSTSYCINCYMLLSTFRNITSSTWNLRPARWGITTHRRIKKQTLNEHLHMHSRRQPIFIADQMFELQPSCWVLQIAKCPRTNPYEPGWWPYWSGGDQRWRQWRRWIVYLVLWYRRRQFGHPGRGPTSRPGAPW